jgi:hypothetical protein
VNELETARETYDAFKRTDAFVNWRCADALIAALTARVEELEREQSAPWHVGAFIEVDGLTVGPHMVRDWRERLEQAEAALLNQQALATANVELAKRAEQAEAREDAWMGEEQIQRTRAEQAEAEVEWLKCCGNCGHLSVYADYEGHHLGCKEQDAERMKPPFNDRSLAWELDPPDPCHFTPSRWTAREDG